MSPPRPRPGHTGRDPARIAEVTVDAGGFVRAVVFLPDAEGRSPRHLAEAVLAGYDEAELARLWDRTEGRDGRR
ncbi:hypothetical protein Afil01_16820 [Actinorhabdospora filicis]|uniref:Uncharacterized protein n=1 Tax=Actinorhabdospora filicis TaxID=1785913 RepID=A0A9W6SJ28_9ACTN|nr:hypothetical protein [Actinorhabdospora filicis]GLZ76875.1 hypothetical protein Afil01_16820 [Actinorhabdospora filicis]